VLGFVVGLTSWAVELVSTLGYPGIVLVMALENVFPPIPSEAVMPLAGYLTTTGRFNFYLTIFSGVLGSLLGALLLYYLGLVIGSRKIRRFLADYGKYLMITTSELDASEQWFNRHGEKAVLFARVVPLVRSIISIPAGFIKMPLERFVLFSVVGITVWTVLETLVGVVLGRNWERFGVLMENADLFVVAVILILVIYFVFRKFKSNFQFPNTNDQ
jgi:membrane protein DedA with SNARE-associated domain